MPTYVYQREDGTTFELSQRITAAPLAECPTTHQKVHRVISGGTGFILKGTGFYKTDYVSNGENKAADDEAASTETKDTKKEDKAVVTDDG